MVIGECNKSWKGHTKWGQLFKWSWFYSRKNQKWVSPSSKRRKVQGPVNLFVNLKELHPPPPLSMQLLLKASVRRSNSSCFNSLHPLHYAKVVKTRFEVVNFDKLILHQFSTKMSQIFNDGVKTSKCLKK